MEDFDRNKHFEFGTSNPTLMEKPFWTYMVSNPHLTGFAVKPKGIYDQHRAIWCFARMGATQTFLPDGRLIQIGGEHEDSYDDDFQIYNDVVVIRNPRMTRASFGYSLPVPKNFPLDRERRLKININQEILGTSNPNDVIIYGYPEEVFPPTDFHTATYVKNNEDEFIYIIGGLGYAESSHCRETHVHRLRVSDFTISQFKTLGNGPKGCTQEHRARLVTEKGKQIIEILTEDNVVYGLDIETAIWEPRGTKSDWEKEKSE